MAEFFLEKVEECKQAFKSYFTKVTIADDVLTEVGRKFEQPFRAALTDDASETDRQGHALWKLTADPLKARVRKLAALAEYYAREDGSTQVTLDHVTKALVEVRADCPVTTEPLKKRRFDYCWWS